MTRYLLAYVATLTALVAIDAVWISVMASRLYRPTLGDIMLPKFSAGPAAIFYVIFIVGVVIFAVSPAISNGRWTTALLYGALFGFFSFGLYDSTNWATLRNWTATLTFADVAWGTFVTGTAATLGFLASTLVS